MVLSLQSYSFALLVRQPKYVEGSTSLLHKLSKGILHIIFIETLYNILNIYIDSIKNNSYGTALTMVLRQLLFFLSCANCFDLCLAEDCVIKYGVVCVRERVFHHNCVCLCEQEEVEGGWAGPDIHNKLFSLSLSANLLLANHSKASIWIKHIYALLYEKGLDT